MNKLKSGIREQCRAARVQIGHEAQLNADTRIAARLGQLVSDLGPTIVSVFWPITQAREIDTRPFIDSLVRSGIAVALPCVSPGEPGVMHMRQFSAEDDLRTNNWGSKEPASGRQVAPTEVDLVVVPALAAGRNGNRIGYGSGYYDRFLKLVHCPSVAIVYSSCLFDQIPADPHDVRVTYVITELEAIVTGEPAT